MSVAEEISTIIFIIQLVSVDDRKYFLKSMPLKALYKWVNKGVWD